MNEITYAIYDSKTKEGGIYNVLASFLRGLYKGFQEAGLKVYDFEDCIKNKINYDVAIGFNMAGVEHWSETIGSNKINVIWTVDSIFGQNAPVFKKCNDINNVITFCVTAGDYQPAKLFMPNLKYMYMPHATDKDLWKKEELEKENDIVFLSSVVDYEAKLESIKENKLLYSIVNELISILEKKPNLSFWDMYVLLNQNSDFKLDYENYTNLYYFVNTVVENKQKVRMIQALSNLNVKVYGSELWKKYIKGKVQYMGKAELYDTVKITNKSKIALHCHCPGLNYGLHERILNASSVGTFSLVSDTDSIKSEFQDTFGYFNHATFEDIEDKAVYYLNNESEREEKAQRAMKITHEKHLWKNRAESINELFLP